MLILVAIMLGGIYKEFTSTNRVNTINTFIIAK